MSRPPFPRGRRPLFAAIGVVVVLIVAIAAWRAFQKPAEDEETATPSALVTFASVRSGPARRIVKVYGVIAAAPNATRTVSASREVIVQDVLTAPGLAVAAGAPLVQVADTPASGLAYRQAADALIFAQRDLARVQRLYDQQLAANDQLIAARKAVADAQAAVAAQTAAGAGRSRQIITAPIAGVVSQVAVARGQQVAAGGSLLTVVATGGYLAQFGVEPTQAGHLAVGQSVRIVSALDPGLATQSRLTAVGHAVDPATRLVPAAAPASSAGLALGAAVRGEIVTATLEGLTVPAASVVYDEKGAHVFIAKGGKAHEVAVEVGPEDGDQVMVVGGLGANDQVIVSGAYQAQDGMAVRLAGAKTPRPKASAGRASGE
jgi:RND family efflux transporter MFP subunit